VEKPSFVVWQHIDLFKANLALFFRLSFLYHIKTTRIFMSHLLYLVNPIFLACLSASDAPAPVASTECGV